MRIACACALLDRPDRNINSESVMRAVQRIDLVSRMKIACVNFFFHSLSGLSFDPLPNSENGYVPLSPCIKTPFLFLLGKKSQLDRCSSISLFLSTIALKNPYNNYLSRPRSRITSNYNEQNEIIAVSRKQA